MGNRMVENALWVGRLAPRQLLELRKALAALGKLPGHEGRPAVEVSEELYGLAQLQSLLSSRLLRAKLLLCSEASRTVHASLQ